MSAPSQTPSPALPLGKGEGEPIIRYMVKVSPLPRGRFRGGFHG